MKNNEKRITRSEHSKELPYTVISNQLIDSDLSFNAKLILITILRQIDFYQFHVNHFSKKLGCSKTVVEKSIKELILKGYCIKKTLNRRNVTYHFFEQSQINVTTNQSLINSASNELVTNKQSLSDHKVVTYVTTNQSLSDQNLVTNKYYLNNKVINELSNVENENEMKSIFDKLNDVLNNYKSNPLNKSKMEITITLSKKEIIKEKLTEIYSSFNEFEKGFEKWYNWLITKESENKVMNLVTYCHKFNSFMKKDYELNANKKVESGSTSNSIKKLNEDEKRLETLKKAIQQKRLLDESVDDEINTWLRFFRSNFDLEIDLDRKSVSDILKYIIKTDQQKEKVRLQLKESKLKIIYHKQLIDEINNCLNPIQAHTEHINTSTKGNPIPQEQLMKNPLKKDLKILSNEELDMINKKAIQLEKEMDSAIQQDLSREMDNDNESPYLFV